MFARESENNIKRQTELEDALVKRGAGSRTDVLRLERQRPLLSPDGFKRRDNWLSRITSTVPFF